MTEMIAPDFGRQTLTVPVDFGTGLTLGRLGHMTVRLAANEAEVKASQRLRYQIFFEAAGHKQSGQALLDTDRFDDYCEHLLVIDEAHAGSASGRIVGTYRLLREERSLLANGYYSQNMFDVRGLMSSHPDRRFLELGRSCVLPEYRSKRTVELLWQGIWAFCRIHAIDVMFGCASFPGNVPAAHALALSFLHQHARAEGDWRVAAIGETRTPMDLVPSEAVDLRAALAAMPPLIKGYLRLGAKFGDGAVIDHEFGTTDVFVIVRTENITDRYLNHFHADATRFV